MVKATKILVVDDETDIQEILSEYLGHRGYSVEVASTLQSGQGLLDRGGFDAVILDLNLRGANGLTLLEEVRGLDSDLCVIIITGNATAHSAIEALRRHADDYLIKPFELDELDHALERALESRRLRRRNRALISRLRRVNRALDERVSSATRKLRLLLDHARGLGGNLDLERTLERVAEGASALTHASTALVLLGDARGEGYEIEACWPAPQAGVELGPVRTGLAVDVGRSGRPIRHWRTQGHLAVQDPLAALKPQTVLAVPMIWEERAIGSLVLLDRIAEKGGEGAQAEPAAKETIVDFTDEDEELALAFAAHAAIAIVNAQIVDEERQLARRQSQFVVLVSHELRTPLTAMKGSLENLDISCRDQLQAEAQNQLSICMHGMDDLDTVFQRILTMAEIGGEELDLKAADGRELTEEAVERVQPAAVRKGIRIEIAAADPAPHARVDRRRLLQALSELLSNAIKFSENGKTVRVEIEESDTAVRFHVIDHGIGIDAHQQEQIFRPFSQIDDQNTRVAGGIGLGLTVCRAIVERHGGRVQVISSLGKGSRFTIEVPAAVEVERSENEDEDPIAQAA